ncbi:MAG: preprotein translocase subunit SecE [Candidatus Colwellbacteria bacterium CG10_big_fil_rev_8_21_14_0_10_42_22]|uniref:Protein translocase subunit SecE n=1 Tax=Candidatus Colwellbacteria bacterium CG10_big_fil_rev_8_21_14_0_10_42_22 TaxID=1974540 RepID=A0A2H0VF68_9BACT|nr:MAG: preprotein translocase subunit SecE [Candidatus Colwellbacteria bacterium CG10_big_fil_rev_8_21_14_0_10_42_22]
MFSKFRLYIKESTREFKRINWPSRKEATVLVMVVIVVSLIIAAYLGALDFAFVYLLELIVK